MAEAKTPFADLDVMREDAEKQRGDKPFVFMSIKEDTGVGEVVKHIESFISLGE